MLFPQAVDAAISLAKGIISISNRLDKVYAEKEAIQGVLAIAAPDFNISSLLLEDIIDRLQELIESAGDVSAEDKTEIEKALKNPGNNRNKLHAFYTKYFPDEETVRRLRFGQTYKELIVKANPAWAEDPGVAQAFYYLEAGKDKRRKGYTWRVALIVVDALAELGAENSGLFVRNTNVEPIVKSVLTRFGSADVQTLDSTSGLIKAVLAATINGALDTQAHISTDSRSLNVLLDVLSDIREQVNGEDAVLGLLNGRGYQRLVGGLLDKSAVILGEKEGSAFRNLAATYIEKAADIITEAPDLRSRAFVRETWGDLLRAGFDSIGRHGPALLNDQNGIVANVMTGVMEHLSSRSDTEIFSPEVLYGMVDAAIGAAILDDQLIKDGINSPWLETFVLSVGDTLASAGIRAAITQEGLRQITTEALAAFAQDPQLLERDSKLYHALIGGVLETLSKTHSFSAEQLGKAAVTGALDALHANPQLLGFKFSGAVTSLSGQVSLLVKEKKLNSIQGADLLNALVATVAENPQLLITVEQRFSQWVIDIVVKTAKDRPEFLIAGDGLVHIVIGIVRGLSRTGIAARENHAANVIKRRLEELIVAGLTASSEELGKRVNRSDIPDILQSLVEKWAKGELPPLDPQNENFRKVVSDIISKVTG